MRTLPAIIICLSLTVAATAEVSVRACRCDGRTPLPLKDPNTPGTYSDIMVGTRLVLVVSSDTAKGWSGGLLLTLEDWERGKLLGRGFDPDSPLLNYRDSCLEAAGVRALTASVEYLFGDVSRNGFDFVTDGKTTLAGDWFVVDYRAEKPGACAVDFFDYGQSVDTPVKTLTLTHVPSRDFDADTRVNFVDFALLACQWGQTNMSVAATRSVFDLDTDGVIGPADIALFSEYWLERPDCNEPATTPDAGVPGP